MEEIDIIGVIEVAPAFTTIGVFYDPTRVEPVASGRSPFEVLKANIESALGRLSFTKVKKIEASVVEIPVCYGGEFGPDLAEVAHSSGLEETEVIRRHASGKYRAACIGFVSGFPFLSGLPQELTTPRRASPRKEVPAGSIGIGGAQTGIYPTKLPGGWNLIGRTPLRLFDAHRNPPIRIRMGDHVIFREISPAEFNALMK